MTAVLHHSQPPKQTAANQKSPVSVPASAVHHADAGSAALGKTKFQTLLDQAVSKPLVPVDSSLADKTKLPKSRADQTVEKHREPKKADQKAAKADNEAPWAAAVQAQPKPDQTSKPAKSDIESASVSTDKAQASKTDPKAEAKADRRTGRENGQALVFPQGVPETVRNYTPNPGLGSQKERSEDKQKVFVVDRRTDSKEKEKLKLPGAEAAAQQPVVSPPEVQVSPKGMDQKNDEVQATFQSVSGKGQGSFDIEPQAAVVSPRDAASFQQYLVDRGYGQMVDQARIILRNENAGEIRMTLYPESLGKVKVSLNLSDNSLAGQIFVDNQTVKDVFQANMDDLLQAFRDGGWNDLSLQVSVGGEGGPGGGAPGQPRPQAQNYERQVAQTVSVEGQANRIGSWNDRQINLTA